MRDPNASRTYLKTDRACQELRRGGMVLLRLSNGAACLLQAAELLGEGSARRDRAETDAEQAALEALGYGGSSDPGDR